MNGYTQIQIGDKAVGLKFAWLAMKWFMQASIEKVDVYFTQENGVDYYTDFGMAKLIQCAYRNNNEIKEVKDELTFEDFHTWVSEQAETEEGKKVLANILQVYTDSSFSKKLAAETEKKSNHREMITSP